MASIDRADPVIMGHVLAQHRELHDRLVEARAAFIGTAGGPTAAATARRRVTDLREYLARHFAQEERGGFLEESLARMPRLSRAVRDVLAEHPALLAEIDGLLERLAARDIVIEVVPLPIRVKRLALKNGVAESGILHVPDAFPVHIRIGNG